MSETPTSEPPQIKSRLGAILRATSGNFLEQFDFFLFGFYASYIAKARSARSCLAPISTGSAAARG